MNWTEADIYTSSEGIDPVCGRLMRIGINGFRIKDAADFEEFLERKDGNWDYYDDDLAELRNCETCVTVYLEDNPQGAEMLSMLKSEMAALKEYDTENRFGRLAVELSGVNEEDWANNWKQYFKPFKIGEKLLIKPTWESCDSEGRTVLEIDPASSFGTGQHDTTKLCLELAEKYIKDGDRMLDLGCGSGILSIGGYLLGASECSAADIDSGSVRTAEENAAKNNIPADKYKTYFGNIIDDENLRGEILKNGKFNIITANIVADVLIAMAPLFGEFAADKCVLVISGIILERSDEVISAVKEQGCELLEIKESKGWAAAAFLI